jgi:hypothetical protein
MISKFFLVMSVAWNTFKKQSKYLPFKEFTKLRTIPIKYIFSRCKHALHIFLIPTLGWTLSPKARSIKSFLKAGESLLYPIISKQR